MQQNRENNSKNPTNFTNLAKSIQIKAIQLIIVIFLLISAFYIGKMSMLEQMSALSGRISQLEMQIHEIESKTPIKRVPMYK